MHIATVVANLPPCCWWLYWSSAVVVRCSEGGGNLFSSSSSSSFSSSSFSSSSSEDLDLPFLFVFHESAPSPPFFCMWSSDRPWMGNYCSLRQTEGVLSVQYIRLSPRAGCRGSPQCNLRRAILLAFGLFPFLGMAKNESGRCWSGTGNIRHLTVSKKKANFTILEMSYSALQNKINGEILFWWLSPCQPSLVVTYQELCSRPDVHFLSSVHTVSDIFQTYFILSLTHMRH